MPKKTFCYEYPRPALTVDAVVFGLDLADRSLKLLLIERLGEPFKGHWALPGGFVNMDEPTEKAVLRELEEETSLTGLYLEQLYTFSGVDRDPRERVVSVAYYGLVSPDSLRPRAGSDAKTVEWHKADDLPPLAFDHAEIVRVGLERLRGKIRYQPVGFELLPPQFTLTQLQRMYEIILGRPLDKRNFRKKVLSLRILRELDAFEGRARLYKFDWKSYHFKVEQGFSFEL